MRKNRFFDIIMISLILMTSFKLLYPDAFTFTVDVNNYVTNSGSSGSDGSDPDYEDDEVPTFNEETLGDYIAYLNLGDSPINSSEFDKTVYPSGEVIYSDVVCITVADASRQSKVLYGNLYCYLSLEGNLMPLYKFSVYNSSVFDNSMYQVVQPEDCYWVCPDSAPYGGD